MGRRPVGLTYPGAREAQNMEVMMRKMLILAGAVATPMLFGGQASATDWVDRHHYRSDHYRYDAPRVYRYSDGPVVRRHYHYTEPTIRYREYRYRDWD
jgi:hypothetical protein